MSLLLALCTTETILRIPPTHHMALQFRHGALPLLVKLAKLQQDAENAGKPRPIEVTLCSPHSAYFGTKLFAPVMQKFPTFQLATDVVGPVGEQVLERHWRIRAMEVEASSSLRMMVVGSRDVVNKLWLPEESVVVDAYKSISKDERKKKKAEGKLPNPLNDHTMENLYSLIEDALSAPETPISDILKTSNLLFPHRFPLFGNSYMLSASKQ